MVAVFYCGGEMCCVLDLKERRNDNNPSLLVTINGHELEDNKSKCVTIVMWLLLQEKETIHKRIRH